MSCNWAGFVYVAFVVDVFAQRIVAWHMCGSIDTELIRFLCAWRCGSATVKTPPLADLDQLTDEERATVTNVIDALVTKAKLRLITGGAG